MDSTSLPACIFFPELMVIIFNVGVIVEYEKLWVLKSTNIIQFKVLIFNKLFLYYKDILAYNTNNILYPSEQILETKR